MAEAEAPARVPCEKCQSEFDRLAVALRNAEVNGHHKDRLERELATARAEIERLKAAAAEDATDDEP